MENYELRINDKKVEAPPKELELLYHLASNPNKVYTRNQLLDEVGALNISVIPAPWTCM
jgi:DNA-binding response OmpR family regulator